MQHYNSSKLIFSFLLFLTFHFSSIGVSAQTSQPLSWIQTKVNNKMNWYESRGFNLSGYDWSDNEFNNLLGEYENAVKRTKVNFIVGGSIAGAGSLLLLNGIAMGKKECGTGFFSSGCDFHNSFRTFSLTSGGLSVGVGGVFLLVGGQRKFERDTYFVKMAERYKELHLESN